MTLSITLDWLALTFKERTREQQNFVAMYASAETVRDETARNGYSSAIRDGNGVVQMWHIDRDEMGLHVIFAGSALRNIFLHHAVSQRDLLERAVNSGGRITRLDIAKDAQDEPINLATIWERIQAKETKGDARTFSTIVNQDGARTIYIGSRQSERFARIYNKLAEQGLTKGHWYRYELETKGMVARALANLLVRETNWAGAFDAMALHMLDIPTCEDYRALFRPGVVQVSIPKLERQTDREAWIQSQVIKAIAEHLTEFPDSPAIKLLMETLEFIRRSQKGLET